ncbi:MAG: hypothetical protein IH803_08560 [Nitrospirae bacterium]|nr:hypothetical protein [Nitrospirota bacterium]
MNNIHQTVRITLAGIVPIIAPWPVAAARLRTMNAALPVLPQSRGAKHQPIHRFTTALLVLLTLMATWPAYGQELYVLRTEAGLEFYQVQEIPKGELTTLHPSTSWDRYLNLGASESSAGQPPGGDLFALPRVFQSDRDSKLYRGFRTSSLGRVISIEGRFVGNPRPLVVQMAESNDATGVTVGQGQPASSGQRLVWQGSEEDGQITR